MKQINEKTWQSDNGLITFVHGDCMEFMAGCKEKEFELACVDPPYGINFAKTHTGSGWIVRESKDWDKSIPPAEYFTELFRISKNQIIWGGNYFTHYLYPSMGWIFWDKGQRDFSLADGELAWTSFDRALRAFNFSRAKLNNQRGDHPTEKPIALYRWIFKNYTNPTDHIFDSHGGSMSSAIAAHMEGLRMTIIELDEEYFQKAIKRFATYESQQTIIFDL